MHPHICCCIFIIVTVLSSTSFPSSSRRLLMLPSNNHSFSPSPSPSLSLSHPHLRIHLRDVTLVNKRGCLCPDVMCVGHRALVPDVFPAPLRSLPFLDRVSMAGFCVAPLQTTADLFRSRDTQSTSCDHHDLHLSRAAIVSHSLLCVCVARGCVSGSLCLPLSPAYPQGGPWTLARAAADITWSTCTHII